MMNENFQRMIRLAEEFFDAKNDPAQISVDRVTMKRLGKIHPATMTERKTSKGPIVWVLLLPTTLDLMEQFISDKISERQLLRLTPLRGRYDAVYLCSALVLPEHRGKGLATRVAVKAVKAIEKDHPIQFLFYWAFSPEGKKLAAAIARDVKLPLLHKKSRVH